MSSRDLGPGQLDRRAFFHHGSLCLLGVGASLSHVPALFADESKPELRLGLVTDMHYADKPPAGSRHYRETLAKLSEAAERFKQDQPRFVVELGDFIDAAESVEVELGYLKTINAAFAALPGEKHYVLGNHCVHTLTKDEFLNGVGQQKSYYSFNSAGYHFVILDSCFRSDGKPYGRKNFQWTDPNIPAEELEWLQADLKAANGKVTVFAHQRLDVSNHYGVKNAAAVRKVLVDAGNVLAVFQGHSHRNDYNDIAGIHYCTLVAMVEGSGETNNGYSTMELFADGSIRITGQRQQQSYGWS